MPNIKFDINLTDSWENIKVRLGLPDDPIRKIDENYTPPPVRYIITSIEIAAVLTKEETSGIVSCNDLNVMKYHGHLGKYAVYSEIMFPSNKLLVFEDTEDNIKLLVSAQCDLVF